MPRYAKPASGSLDRIEGQRHQQIEVVIDHLESARHHTGDHARLRVDADGAAHHARIAAEAPLPVSIAEHHSLRSARVLVGRRQPLPGGGRHIERLQNAVRNQRRVDLLRLRDPRDACGPRQPHAHRLEARLCAAKVRYIEADRRSSSRKSASPGAPGAFRRKRNQLLRLRIRKRPDQHAVEHAEDRCIGADADGQREDDGDREPWRPREPAAYMLQIHQQRFESLPLPHFAAALLKERHIAEFAARGSFGFLARHALFHQFVDPLVDVFLDGDGDVVVAAIAEESD